MANPLKDIKDAVISFDTGGKKGHQLASTPVPLFENTANAIKFNTKTEPSVQQKLGGEETIQFQRETSHEGDTILGLGLAAFGVPPIVQAAAEASEQRGQAMAQSQQHQQEMKPAIIPHQQPSFEYNRFNLGR